MPSRSADPSPEPADAAAHVAKSLEEDIIFGRLPPGSRLVEDPLMARFGATRHAVRQALADLERVGIVAREKNKGAMVRALTAAEVEHIYALRELLVRQAVLRIPVPAPKATLEALARLQAAFRAHLRDERWRDLHDANDAFHLALCAGCGNSYLVDSIRHAMNLSLPVRAGRMTDAAQAKASAREHDMMIKMLQGTDRWALAQLCVDHLQPARQRYLAAHSAS